MTSGLPYPQSPARWLIMQALAEADGPLNRRQLADASGISPANVRETMLRPQRAGWVTWQLVYSHPARTRKLMYEITDLGRKILADHLGEETP